MKNYKTVFIAFGSNKGDAMANIKKALTLAEGFCRIITISPLFTTKPEGYLDQADFTNGVFEAQTLLTPQELLKALKTVEAQLGRKESFRNAPREIDLDILFYESEIIDIPGLNIPHKSLTEREFVLAPLAEISPDLVHPANKKTIRVLLQELMLRKNNSTISAMDADAHSGYHAALAALAMVTKGKNRQ